jgi:hypothetical protein
VKKSASNGYAFFQFFKTPLKITSYRFITLQVLILLMMRLLTAFKLLDLSAEERHCLISGIGENGSRTCEFPCMQILSSREDLFSDAGNITSKRSRMLTEHLDL